MKKTKSLLAIKTAKIKEEEIYNYPKLPYTKVAIFYLGNKEIQCKIPTKIKIIHCENIRDLNDYRLKTGRFYFSAISRLKFG